MHMVYCTCRPFSSHSILELANGYKNFKRFRHRALFVLNKHESPLKEPRDTSLIKLPGKERGPYNKKTKI